MEDNKSPKGLYPDEIAEFYKCMTLENTISKKSPSGSVYRKVLLRDTLKSEAEIGRKEGKKKKL